MPPSASNLSNLSDIQEHVLSFISIAPAILSIVASSTILYLTWRSGFSSSYKRILFGLSVADINTSVTFVVQPFLIPADTSQRIWASGNDATCTLLGTITQLNLATGMYNGTLSFYYLFIIRFGVKDSVFARRYEPWMHAVSILVPLATALAGAGMDMYHEVDIWFGCWITNYPQGCSQEMGNCQTVLYSWLFMGSWCIFLAASIAINNLAIYRHVKYRMDKGSRRSLHADQQNKRTKEVAIQAFLYVAAYVGTFVWAWVLKFVDDRNNRHANEEAKFFPLMVLSGLLVPSTGFFNLCIYLRPRYLKTRSDFPAESLVWAVKRALYGESVPPTNSNDFCSPTKSHRNMTDGPMIVNNAPDSYPEHHIEESSETGHSDEALKG